MVSVVYYTFWVVGSNPTLFRINFFFFQIEETCTFMNISSLKYHLRKSENSSTLCKFHERRKGLPLMADPFWRSVRLSLRLPPHTMVRAVIFELCSDPAGLACSRRSDSGERYEIKRSAKKEKRVLLYFSSLSLLRTALHYLNTI